MKVVDFVSNYDNGRECCEKCTHKMCLTVDNHLKLWFENHYPNMFPDGVNVNVFYHCPEYAKDLGLTKCKS